MLHSLPYLLKSWDHIINLKKSFYRKGLKANFGLEGAKSPQQIQVKLLFLVFAKKHTVHSRGPPLEELAGGGFSEMWQVTGDTHIIWHVTPNFILQIFLGFYCIGDTHVERFIVSCVQNFFKPKISPIRPNCCYFWTNHVIKILFDKGYFNTFLQCVWTVTLYKLLPLRLCCGVSEDHSK